MSSPFSRRLLGQMLRARAQAETGDPNARTSPFWDDWREGLHPALRADVDDILAQDRVRPHDYLAALHSSMGFALNLFLPFRMGAGSTVPGRAPLGALLSETLGRTLTVDHVQLEYGGPGGVLGEIAGDLPEPDEKYTAADVAIHVHDGTRRGLVLVEVKLSEDGYTPCGGANSRGNRRKDVCASADRFFADPSACYLRRPYHARRDRRYWDIFAAQDGSVRAAFPGVPDGPCPFVGNAQQILRNHALALGSVQAGLAEFAAVILVHHDDNPDVVPPWEAYRSTLADPSPILRLPASRVAAASPHAAWLRSRYRLE